MAKSVEEVVRFEQATSAAEAVEVTKRNLTTYCRQTAIYSGPQWDAWCEYVKADLDKRKDALIDAVDEAEKARLQGMCHVLRWILRQKEEAENRIFELRVAVSDTEGAVPAAGVPRAQAAAGPNGR